MRALRVLELLLLLHPDSVEDLRDRGLVYAALDCYAPGRRATSRPTSRGPAGPEADELAAKIAELRRKAARLN